MADVVIRGVTYTGVDTVSIPADGGGTETFMQPSGAISITENGVVDVTQYASAAVNVSGGGGGPTASDAILLVTAPANSVVTMTKGADTRVPTIWLQAADPTLETALFVVEAADFDAQNAWTVTAVSSTDTASATVIIDTNNEYDMVLSFNLYIFKSGVGQVVPMSFLKQTNGTIVDNNTQITVGYTTTNSGQIACFNTSAIDINAYSKLHVVIKVTDNYTTAAYRGCIFVASSTPAASDDNNNAKYVAKTYPVLDGTAHDVELSLSAISSSVLSAAYVGYRGISKGEITYIYLTK